MWPELGRLESAARGVRSHVAAGRHHHIALFVEGFHPTSEARLLRRWHMHGHAVSIAAVYGAP